MNATSHHFGRRQVLGTALAGIAAAAVASRVTKPATRSQPVKLTAGTPLLFVNYFPAQRGGPEQWSNYDGATVRADMAIIKGLGFNGLRVQLAASASGLGWPHPTGAYLTNMADFYAAAQANGLLLHLSCYDMFGGRWTDISGSQTWLSDVIANFRAVDSSLAQIAVLETHNEAFSAANQSQWPQILPWVQAVTLAMRSAAPGIPVTTSVPSGQGTSAGGLGTYYRASVGTNWQPDWYDYHLYGGLNTILSQLQTAQAVVGAAGLHIGEFGWDVEGTTEGQADLTAQAQYAQNGRHYCQQAGLPEPYWWMLYDVTPGTEFTSGQCDGLFTVAGAVKPSGQIYQQYPPGVAVPLYGTQQGGPGTPYIMADYTSGMAGGPTFTVPVNKKALTAGDSVCLEIGTSGTLTLVSVTDSQGQSYAVSNPSHSQRSVSYAHLIKPAKALTTADLFTVTLSSAAGDVRVVAHGIPGVSAVDKIAGNGASGSSPSVSTGTLSAANEVLIGSICNSGGTQPSGLSFTLSEYEGTTPVLTTAYKVVTSTASQTWSATISGGAAYDIGVITFR